MSSGLSSLVSSTPFAKNGWFSISSSQFSSLHPSMYFCPLLSSCSMYSSSCSSSFLASSSRCSGVILAYASRSFSGSMANGNAGGITGLQNIWLERQEHQQQHCSQQRQEARQQQSATATLIEKNSTYLQLQVRLFSVHARGVAHFTSKINKAVACVCFRGLSAHAVFAVLWRNASTTNALPHRGNFYSLLIP